MYSLLILKLSQNINTIIIHCTLIFVSVTNTFYCRKLDIKIKTKLKYSKYYVKEILHALYYTRTFAVSIFFSWLNYFVYLGNPFCFNCACTLFFFNVTILKCFYMGPICIWRHLANLPLCVTQYLFKWYILLYNEAFIGWQVSCHMVIFIKVKQPCDDQYNNPLKGRFCGEFSNILLQAVFNSRHCSSVPLCHFALLMLHLVKI